MSPLLSCEKESLMICRWAPLSPEQLFSAPHRPMGFLPRPNPKPRHFQPLYLVVLFVLPTYLLLEAFLFSLFPNVHPQKGLLSSFDFYCSCKLPPLSGQRSESLSSSPLTAFCCFQYTHNHGGDCKGVRCHRVGHRYVNFLRFGSFGFQSSPASALR